MLRFRFLDVPFEVDLTFWVFSAILGADALHQPDGGLLLAVWVACVFVSIVVHESGHAQAARHYGASPTVRLYAMGGLTRPGQAFTRGQNLIVVLCGPAAGFALWLAVHAFYFVAASVPALDDFLAGSSLGSHAVVAALRNLSFINLWWTALNLLPVLPLDGGLLLLGVLGYGRAGVARIIGVACAAGCAVYAYSVGQTYTAFFFGYLALQNFQMGVGR